MVTTSKDFKYIGCEISYENEKDNQNNLAKFVQILGILNSTLKTNLVDKYSRKKVCNALAVPGLL
jgi:hypothetical protein